MYHVAERPMLLLNTKAAAVHLSSEETLESIQCDQPSKTGYWHSWKPNLLHTGSCSHIWIDVWISTQQAGQDCRRGRVGWTTGEQG